MFLNNFWGRVLFAFVILLADAAFFILPLAALFLAYVIIARPPWFKEWVDKLYG